MPFDVAIIFLPVVITTLLFWIYKQELINECNVIASDERFRDRAIVRRRSIAHQIGICTHDIVVQRVISEC